MKLTKKIIQTIFICMLTTLTQQNTLKEATKEILEVCKSVSDFNKIYKNELENRTLKILFTPPKQKKNKLDQEIEDELNIPIKMGKGAFGVTYGYLWNSKPIAIKLIKTSKTLDNINNQISEIKIMKTISNTASTPKFIDCAYEETKENQEYKIKLYIVQEYMHHNLDNPDFLKWLRSSSVPTRGKFYKSLYNSLAPLQSLRISHNDIKPDNIMIGLNPDPLSKLFSPVKLIDFGLSESYGKDVFLSTKCYDMYKPPGSKFSGAYDIYAMSVTILELESSFGAVCGEYMRNDCYDKKDSLCLGYLKSSGLGIFKPIFGTRMPKNGIFKIEECRDFGCIVLSCLKITKSHMPSLSRILEAFDYVENGVFEEIEKKII